MFACALYISSGRMHKKSEAVVSREDNCFERWRQSERDLFFTFLLLFLYHVYTVMIQNEFLRERK
jgi:hypothetical protein